MQTNNFDNDLSFISTSSLVNVGGKGWFHHHYQPSIWPNRFCSVFFLSLLLIFRKRLNVSFYRATFDYKEIKSIRRQFSLKQKNHLHRVSFRLVIVAGLKLPLPFGGERKKTFQIKRIFAVTIFFSVIK